MVAKPPVDDTHEDHASYAGPEEWATGAAAVAVSMRRALSEMGALTTARTLLKVNHADGFDCPRCAWPDPDPDPDHRKMAEFCENGAKHVAAEATLKRVTPAFFAVHSLTDLATKSDR